MRIVHIMRDGSTRESVEGVVVRNKEFYQVLNGILAKKNEVGK